MSPLDSSSDSVFVSIRLIRKISIMMFKNNVFKNLSANWPKNAIIYQNVRASEASEELFLEKCICCYSRQKRLLKKEDNAYVLAKFSWPPPPPPPTFHRLDEN